MISRQDIKLRNLRIAFWALLTAAALVAALPLPIPIPLRIAVASIDLIAAAVVWLALRQARAS
ncbi:MAG: hypothetical protein MUE42_00505 [Opitutaceae bacterium]|jgi:hypothetical protein|nr:hypothetical protein [Opitutaceae bacterium]